MSVLVFVIVLVALILVHEFGHFVAAKLAKMRVDEFGIGYPPRLWGTRSGETEYTVNALPFGGFVRIYGEDMHAVEADPDRARAFASRPRALQAAVLLAGIAMNIVFAWVLLSGVLMVGSPRAVTAEEARVASDLGLTVASVMPESPAAKAGVHEGDVIRGAETATYRYDGASAYFSPESFTSFVAVNAKNKPLTISLERRGQMMTVTATPESGIVASDFTRPALGVAVATTGIIPVSPLAAPLEGAKLTWDITKATAVGLVQFFVSAATLSADLSQVSGPVGIAGAVGTASSHGLAALLSLTAIISINLALINLIPIPALDGGRLLFVAIEAVIRRPIRPSIAQAVNAVGFMLLILLMVVVTASDIFKLLG